MYTYYFKLVTIFFLLKYMNLTNTFFYRITLLVRWKSHRLLQFDRQSMIKHNNWSIHFNKLRVI